MGACQRFQRKALQACIVMFLLVITLQPAQQSIAQAVETTIFYEDFSGDYPNGWMVGQVGTPEEYGWAWNSGNGFAHAYSDIDGTLYKYPNNYSGYLERRGLNFAGYSSVTLSFFLIVDVEENYDFLTVSVVNQQGQSIQVFQDSGTSEITWIYREIDLTSFAGQSNLTLRFQLDSDYSNIGEDYDGVYLDDVLLIGIPTSGSPEIRIAPESIAFDRNALSVDAGWDLVDTPGFGGEPLEEAHSTTGPVPPPGISRGLQSAALDPALAVAEVTLNVPAYEWRHGCGPTAAGMVLGYWDGHEYGSLVSGDAWTQTAAVNEMIASAGNYNDYCMPIEPNGATSPLMDNSERLPWWERHLDDSVADFMKTSQSVKDNLYGWSWFIDMEPALEQYVGLVAPQYTADAVNMQWGTFTWDVYRAEIDAGRPVVLLVDTDGNGGTDHFVTAMGYREVGGARQYACRDTWDAGVHWFSFARMANGQDWGILGATLFQIIGAQTNLPKSFTIYNDGTADLTVTGLQENSGWLSLSTEQAPPFTIAPGASKSVEVSVDASGLSPSVYTDRILVYSNDPDESTFLTGIYVTLSVGASNATFLPMVIR